VGMIDAEAVARRELRRLRKEQGWTQADVARRLGAYVSGISRGTIAKIESCDRTLQLNEAVGLAAVFGLTLEALLAGSSVVVADLDAAAAGRAARAEARLAAIRALLDDDPEGGTVTGVG
jgi:transcriptional regulator with XRE-family HTH domain